MIREKQPQIIASFLMAISSFFILVGYEFVRNASNSIFTAAYGVKLFPVALAVMPLAVLFFLFCYNKALSVWGPRLTLFGSTMVSGAFIFASYIGLLLGIKWMSWFLLIFREAYVVIIIEQYWSFLNSILKKEEAKKLNGIVLGLSSLGAVFGDFSVFYLAESLGTVHMLAFSGASFVPSALLSLFAYKKIGKNHRLGGKKERHKTKDAFGLSLFKTNPVLILLLTTIFMTQAFSTLSGILFQNQLHAEYPVMDQQTAASGLLYAWMHVLSLFLQFIGTPIFLHLIPIPVIHIVIPIVHLFTTCYAIFSPSLVSASIAFFAFKCFDYSIFRAAKEILYIPLPFDARFRSKELIDVLGYRVSKGGTSLLLSWAQHLGYFASHSGIAFCAFLASIGWLISVAPLMRIAKNGAHSPAKEC